MPNGAPGSPASLEMGTLSRIIWVCAGGRYYDITDAFLDFLWDNYSEPEIMGLIQEIMMED